MCHRSPHPRGHQNSSFLIFSGYAMLGPSLGSQHQSVLVAGGVISDRYSSNMLSEEIWRFSLIVTSISNVCLQFLYWINVCRKPHQNTKVTVVVISSKYVNCYITSHVGPGEMSMYVRGMYFLY